MKNGDEIKELFSKSFENFEKEVDPGLWDKIQSDLSSGASAGSGSAGAAGKSGLIKSLVIGTVSVAAITGGVLFFMDSDKKDETKNTNETIVNPDQEKKELVENQEDLVVIENQENAIDHIDKSVDPLVVEKKEAIKQKVLSEIKEEAPIDYTGVSLNDLLDQDLLNELSKKDENQNENIVKHVDVKKEDHVKKEEKKDHVNDENNLNNPTNPNITQKKKSEAEKYLEKEKFNVLTPNNDGENDLKVLECKDIKKFEILVFNQAGKLVYENSGRTIRFDGRDNGGNNLDEGTYRMVLAAIDLNDERIVRKSHLTIIR